MMMQPAGTGQEHFLIFTAAAASTIALQNYGGNAPVVYYSLNDGDFALWDYSAISMGTGDVVRMYGNNGTQFNKSNTQYSHFNIAGSVAASGDLNALLSIKGSKTVGESCFIYLFQNNYSSLTSAPNLPATTLANRCYQQLFNNCRAMLTAPSDLPALHISNYSYMLMFQNCPITRVKAMFTDTPGTSYNTTDWLNGVPASGTFIKNVNATWDVTGASGIPEGWTIETASA